MKNSKLRPCDNCGGKLQGEINLGIFAVIKYQGMKIDSDAVRQTMGLSQQLGSFALAEVMSPNPELAKKSGDEVEIFLCADCIVQNNITVSELVGKVMLEKTNKKKDA